MHRSNRLVPFSANPKVFLLMMSGLRDASKGVLGKIVVGILMAFLIASFAVWGINDVFRGGGQADVAKVGKQRISRAEYSENYRRMLQRFQRDRGVSPTTAEVRAAGLDKQLLASMISDAALDDKVRALGLSYAPDAAARAITTDKRFQQDGTFSREMFNGFLQNASMNEQTYLRQLTDLTLRRHITEAVGGNGSSPKVLTELFHKRANEERTIAFIRINDSKIAAVVAPPDADLKTYFAANQPNFRAPEYRAVTYLLLDPADFAGDVVISDADVQADYTAGLADGRFGSPERRTIQQLNFATRDAALAALAKVHSGTGFDSIAVESGQMGTLDVGTRTKAEIGVPALADPIFALAVNGVTDPIESGGQFSLVRVSAITPPVVPVLDDPLKATIRDALRTTRIATDATVRSKLGKLHDEIEDLRGSGKTLAEIAKAKSLKTVDVAAVDGVGRDKADKALALPDATRFLAAIYGSAVGVDNEAIATASSGWLWFEMTGREEARDLTFEEARTKATTRWIDEEKARRIGAKADELKKKLETGQTLEQIATDIGATVETQAGLKRVSQPFGVEAGTALFVTPVNKAAVASVSRAESILFRVTDSTTPPIDEASEETKGIVSQLGSIIADDIVSQYIGGIEAAAGVETYDAALANAIGAQ
jgi:peptidyl-prolyl cis-trans isomerase D